jgi:hypothetical protein
MASTLLLGSNLKVIIPDSFNPLRQSELAPPLAQLLHFLARITLNLKKAVDAMTTV